MILTCNNADDLHFPTLTVDQTVDFALRNKISRKSATTGGDRSKTVGQLRDNILNPLGIQHAGKTLVGNEFIRGVSGGERKRVSLAEVMAGQVQHL